MRALILGGYGFIGLEIGRRLVAAGHDVTCIGRSLETGRRLFPAGTWIQADIAALKDADAWRVHIGAVDVVINASGALQSGLKDHLEAIHHTAIAALVSACESAGVVRFVQISAVGASTSATTEFLRSKARGDMCLKSSTLNWIILRPGLVMGANAYGGTALLRMIASVPVVLPIAYGDSLIQSVAMSDLTDVVLDAVEERLPAQVEFDLVEDNPHSLQAVIVSLRAWLGVAPAHVIFAIPHWLALGTAKLADGLGYLGWRSPLRTTTMQVLGADVIGDPESFRSVSQRKLASLALTLASMPATLQERWFARLYLMMPLMITVLAVFWLMSGLVAMIDVESASRLAGLGPDWGKRAVISGALVDVGLGVGILYRPWSRMTCWGMVFVSLGYLVAGTLLRPDLWADPLGPLLKILPAMTLALVTAALLDVRR